MLHTRPLWAGRAGPALHKRMGDTLHGGSAATIYQVPGDTWPDTFSWLHVEGKEREGMEVWGGSPVLLPAGPLGMWKACAAALCSLKEKGLYSGGGGRKLVVHGELWAIELVFVWYTWGQNGKKCVVSGCLMDVRRVGLRHTERS